jgi:hypothetical protein
VRHLPGPGVIRGAAAGTASTAPVTDKPTPPCGIVVVRLPSRHAPTIDYLERRVSAGNSKRDAIRCLKRYLARELYNDIQAIVTTTQPRSNIAA